MNNVNIWLYICKIYGAGGKQAGAKIMAHFCGPWSLFQPVCNLTKYW